MVWCEFQLTYLEVEKMRGLRTKHQPRILILLCSFFVLTKCSFRPHQSNGYEIHLKYLDLENVERLVTEDSASASEVTNFTAAPLLGTSAVHSFLRQNSNFHQNLIQFDLVLHHCNTLVSASHCIVKIPGFLSVAKGFL